ncbi:hypothetical protein B0H11DRAFT_2184245 [Mycena galericulata]|nr:hypothetical protein B0H11DRAFT_2184245 [Mycena galericulata]
MPPFQPASSNSSSLVTVIITTSPTPSAPSTELLSSILTSFKSHCPTLLSCRVILVLDTYDRIEIRPRLKKGVVNATEAENFSQYKENAKELILREYHLEDARMQPSASLCVSQGQAEYGSEDLLVPHPPIPLTITQTAEKSFTFVEPSQRLGFGLAVRSALRLVETPYVWVQQHDWRLVSDIPLSALLGIMESAPDASDEPSVSSSSNPPVKYVSFPSVRMLSYATSEHVRHFPSLRALSAALKRDFTASSCVPQQGTVPGPRIPMTPLFFWHDKPHLASTEHYLARVFPSQASMPRGAFVEDTAGQRARAEMKSGWAGWARWATWMYYPDDGTRRCLQHLQGRTWRGAETEREFRMKWQQLKLKPSALERDEGTEPEVGDVDSDPAATS